MKSNNVVERKKIEIKCQKKASYPSVDLDGVDVDL